MALLNELAQWLIDGNIASSSGSGLGWYLWRGQMPDSTAIAERGLALLETPGGEPQLPNVLVDRPYFRVLVRGASMAQVSSAYKEARIKAQDARDRLHFAGNTTLSGVRYVLIAGLSEVTYRGEDERQRPVFSCDFQAWREAST